MSHGREQMSTIRLTAKVQDNQGTARSSEYSDCYILRKRLAIYLHRYFPSAYSYTQPTIDIYPQPRIGHT